MNSQDLLAKLERELARLESEVSADTYFNFVITAYHLFDWVKNDEAAPAEVRASLVALRKELPMQVCRDLANGSKHFRLDYSNPVVADATCTTGFGAGRYGVGAFGVGEPSIQVTLADGSVREGLELAREATQLWRAFFAAHGF